MQLASGNGSVTVTASETTTYRLFGLSNGSADANYTEIDFALDLAPSGVLYVYENGVQRGSWTYATGNLLQVSVESGVVKYKKNGAVFYTSTVAPAYPLLVDTSLYSQGATLNSAIITGAWRLQPRAISVHPQYDEGGERRDADGKYEEGERVTYTIEVANSGLVAAGRQRGS